MEAIWPRYNMYSADEIVRGLGRSSFIFCALALLMLTGLLFAVFQGTIPVIVARGLGVLINLLGLLFVSRRHSRYAAGVVAVSNVVVAFLHLFFLQADVALWIALALYSVNMLRATIALRRLKT